MMMQFSPALFGCYIWDGNHSFEMIRRSKECVINVPTADLIDQVVSIGNTSGRDVDKFKRFKLTPVLGSEVNAPLIEECYANFECRLADSKLISKYGVFIWEVVKAHVATSLSILRPSTIAAMECSCLRDERSICTKSSNGRTCDRRLRKEQANSGVLLRMTFQPKAK